jgi:hypothetical protein
MGELLGTLFRTAILDDAAYEDWRERPNLFLRGLILIIAVSLIAGLISFAVSFVAQARPVDLTGIEDGIMESFEMQERFNPAFQDPEMRKMMEQMFDTIVPMVQDIAEIEAPLPRGITGFFKAFGAWLSRALTAIGGFLFYGALVLLFVNLLGGTAKLPEFYGMAALYIIPGLLGLLSPIPCLGALLVFIGMVWSIVVYIKATSVVSGMDGGRSVLAVLAPFFALVLLGVVLSILAVAWFAILF